VDNANLTFKSLSNSLKELEANCGPLSEIILSGNPNHLYRFSRKNLPVSLAVIVLLHGIRITSFVNAWSTMTKIESKPLAGGKSVIRSIEQ